MAIEVFNRYEKKYLIDRESFEWLTERIAARMRPDRFNEGGRLYNIANIYYDTPDDELIRASIEKPAYKEKLRLRSYGVPAPDDEVFLEIKKKCKGLVNKRRTRLKLREAYDLVEKNIEPPEEPYINRQVLREIHYFLSVYRLVPKVCLTYDRLAFFDREDDDFRVTFDTNIRTRRDDVRLEKGSRGDLLMEDGLWLMEVKSSRAVPLWFAELLTERRIYAASFSKYGTEYKKHLIAKYNNADANINIEGELLCLNQYLQVTHQAHQYQPMARLYA